MFIVLGRYDEAIGNYEKSLEIKRNIFNTDDHPSIAVIFSNIASTCIRLERNEEALIYFEKSLKIKRNIFQSDDHQSIA